MLEKLKRLLVEEEGQGLSEYGLIIGLVALAVIALLATLGDQLKNIFNSIINTLSNNGISTS
ncbi:MAG: Flp family type IVb pilin [Bacillaceae bacterium]|nr:Flp family type IVb pilin [Bacillaceae bacterium]